MLYLQFCASLNIAPAPISTFNLGRYIAFLGTKLSFPSVQQYLNVVPIIHLEAGHSNPLSDNWYLTLILKGLRRYKGDGINQKLSITDSILHGILAVLNLSNPFEVCFWAACLVAFFFFRESNFLLASPQHFDPTKHLCLSDVHFSLTGAILSVRGSKIIQFRQKTLYIPLPHMMNSPFCPSTALLLCKSAIPITRNPIPLFSFPSPGGVKPIT